MIRSNWWCEEIFSIKQGYIRTQGQSSKSLAIKLSLQIMMKNTKCCHNRKFDLECSLWNDVRIVFLDQTLVHNCISGTNNLILFLEIYNSLQVEDFTQFLVSWAENAFFLPSEVCQSVVLLSNSVRFFKHKGFFYISEHTFKSNC